MAVAVNYNAFMFLLTSDIILDNGNALDFVHYVSPSGVSLILVSLTANKPGEVSPGRLSTIGVQCVNSQFPAS